jgi:hypothetical protein
MNNSGTSEGRVKKGPRMRETGAADKAPRPRAWIGPSARRSRPPLLSPVSPRAEGVIAFAFLFLLDSYSPLSLPSSLLSRKKIPIPLRNLPILGRAWALGATAVAPPPRPATGPLAVALPDPAPPLVPRYGVRRAFCFLPPHVRDSCFSSFGRLISCLDFALRFVTILSWACVIIA